MSQEYFPDLSQEVKFEREFGALENAINHEEVILIGVVLGEVLEEEF